MQDAARQIRQRIIWIILRAFIGVVFVTLLLVLIATGVALSNTNSLPPLSRFALLARLEGYYAAQGSWQGVEVVVPSDLPITLLDADGRIVLDEGQPNGPRIGQAHVPGEQQVSFPLTLKKEAIGVVLYDHALAPSQFWGIFTILAPVGFVSVFLALLAVLVVALLSRRVVTPLAEVIAASRAVTAGNLSARVQVQGPQDLRVLTDSFNQMAASLERSDQERRDLLADIAHELRTPLSAVRGRLEGILDGVYPPDEQHISLALQSNYLLERLVEDLRLLTLAESRQLTFDKKDADLGLLVARAVEMFSAEAREKNITLSLDPLPDSCIALLDPQRTEQVIANLLGNALRYVPEGGKVWLGLAKTETGIQVMVSDTGPGIHPEDLPYIFNRFWRKDKSRARHSGGSGLGLAIARQLVEAQGGSIRAENLPQGGLQVKVEFGSG